MIFSTDAGKREIPDDLFQKFIAEHGKPVLPSAEDFYSTALAPTSKEEYIKLCGANNFVDLYVTELNRFLAARLGSLLKKT